MVDTGGDPLLYRRSKIDEQNMKLDEAKRNGFDSLGIAININTNLKGQTETMEKNIKRVRFKVINEKCINISLYYSLKKIMMN